MIHINLRELDPALIMPARLGGATVNALFVSLFYLLVLRLFSWRLALISALLVALGPFYIALSRVLHHDALTTTFMVLSLLTMIGYWLKGWRLRWLILSGLAAGLGFLTKSISWYMVPCAAMIGGLSLVYQWQNGPWQGWRNIWRVTGEGLLWGLVAIITVFALFPALWVIPVQTLVGIFDLTAQYAEEGHTKGQYFLGTVYNDPGLLFYPLGWLLKTSPFEVIGILVLPAALWFSIKSKKGQTLRQFIWQHPTQMALLLFVITFFLFENSSNKKFVRYFLPAFPVISIFASFGLLWLVDTLSRFSSNQKLQRSLFPALWASILFVQGVFIGQHAPYYFTYYNPLFGNNASVAKLMTIYGWGDQMSQVANYLNQLPQAEPLRVVSWYNLALQPFFAGKAHDFSSKAGNVMDSDYVVYHINQLQRQMQDEAIWQYFNRHYQPVHRVSFNGLDYALIYRNPITHHVDWEENSLLEVMTTFGYSFLPTGALTLFWQNLGLSVDQTLWLGLSSPVDNKILWVNCQPTSDFVNDLNTNGAIIESLCLLAELEAPTGVYNLHVGLGDENEVTPIDFPDGQLAVVVDEHGQFTAVQRDTALALLAEQLVPKEATPLNILYGDIAGLAGYRLYEPQPNQPMQLTLYWQPTDKLDRALANAFQLTFQFNGNDNTLPSMTTIHPFIPPAATIDTLTPGVITALNYSLDMPPSLPAGMYTLNICVTVAANNQPVFGVASDGAVFQCLPVPITLSQVTD